MSRTVNYIKNLEDFELAFLKEYKLATYLKPTQEVILKEIFHRGLQDYELRDLIKEIEFNKANTGCPRCNSNKIRTDKIDIGHTKGHSGFGITYAAAASGSGIDLQSKGQRISCEICGLVLKDDD